MTVAPATSWPSPGRGDDSRLTPWWLGSQILYKQSTGQQIRSKIDSFQNANFLISLQNRMMLPLIGIVSERRFQ